MKNSLITSWLCVAACSSLLACGSSSSNGSGPSESGWAGTWKCNVTTDLVTPSGPPATGSFAEDFTVTEDSKGQIAVTPLQDAGTQCPMLATASGSTTAAVQADQTSGACVGAQGATYSGTLTLNGNSLTIDYDASGSTGGTFTEKATCTRQ